MWADCVSLECVTALMISKTGFDPAFSYMRVFSSQQMSLFRRCMLLEGITRRRVYA